MLIDILVLPDEFIEIFCFQQIPSVMINIFFVLKYTNGCVLVLLPFLARRIKPILMRDL